MGISRLAIAGIMALGFSGMMLAGCAGVDYTTNTKTLKTGDDLGGIPYYEPARYLLVNSDGKGGLNWQIIALPDQSTLHVAKPYEFISKLETSYTISNGMLTEVSETVDTSAGIKAIGEAVKAFLPLLMAGANAPKVELPAFQLFRIQVVGSKVKFIPVKGNVQSVEFPGSKN